MNLSPAKSLLGTVKVPGDKSISHRAIMFGALSDGDCEIQNFLMSDDCLSTISCFKKLGVHIEVDDKRVLVHGVGMHGLKPPQDTLYTGNSGTTTRLLCGLLSSQKFDSVLDGDASIRTRPMARVVKPLASMGAQIKAQEGNLCPLHIHGNTLCGINYTLPIASAQLKSALILAALYADGETVIHETIPSRNHTEYLLSALSANIDINSSGITVKKTENIKPFALDVPGDISSAAFFLVAATIIPGSELTLEHVGINPSRAGIIEVLNQMGADITLANMHDTLEPVADITVRAASLHGIEISGSIIPNIIDELPIIAVAAAFATGKTMIKDAQELRHKESDRISAMVQELKKAGIDIAETEDGMIIYGGNTVHGGAFSAHHDHRIAMSMAICALAAVSPSTLEGMGCISISYPTFFDDLSKVVKRR